MAGRDRKARKGRLNERPSGAGHSRRSWPACWRERAMIGASLSKWTMSYFGRALLALLGAEPLMIAGFGFPSQPVAAPQTLILVHLVAIGWLSLLLSGTLIQFVPVLVAKPLAHPDLPRCRTCSSGRGSRRPDCRLFPHGRTHRACRISSTSRARCRGSVSTSQASAPRRTRVDPRAEIGAGADAARRQAREATIASSQAGITKMRRMTK